MSEKETNTQNTPTPTTTNVENGNLPETATIIERADATAKRLEESNKRAEEIANRIENAVARLLLSGKSVAGNSKTPEQTETEQLEEKIKATLSRYK